MKIKLIIQTFFNFYLYAIDLSEYWIASCNSILCKQGLEICISSNCLGARQCKAIIDEYSRTCSLCANEILNISHHKLVNGSYYPTCYSGDDLDILACLFYCRSNLFSNGECIRQNNVRICKCGTGTEIATTS